MICVSLWVLWTERNKYVHEKIKKSSKDISFFYSKVHNGAEQIRGKWTHKGTDQRLMGPTFCRRHKNQF
ncbi:hypothetical protein Gogos_021408 [Gossypium gossypioides]|uniref:Uncharacterized protein n=1 Tax=Gossypium gossypioides TaxID=34282 RepID=A0A7J9D204_GOSGO|nr:hypothetical protein [Gossypium gossypioides]